MSDSEDYPERIEDSADYSTKRRLKSVFDIRHEIRDTRKEIKFEAHKSSYRHQAVSAYRALVESYLLEIEPLLRRYGNGEVYLNQYDFGQLTLEPQTREISKNSFFDVELFFPNQRGGNGNDSAWERVPEDNVPEPVTYEFIGLRSLFDAPDTFVLHDDVQLQGVTGTDVLTYVQKAQIPMNSLDLMVRSLNDFISDIGFELEPEHEDDPAHLSL